MCRTIIFLLVTGFLITFSNAQKLTWKIPKDVSIEGDLEDFNRYAWQLFVAMNWPAKNGKADRKTTIGLAPQLTRVWEEFVNPASLFTQANEGLNIALDNQEKPLFLNVGKVPLASNISAELDEQAASSLPLIDQQGMFALNEIYINPLMADYITKNKLNDFDTLSAKDAIRWPFDAIELKATWRMFPTSWKDDHPEVARYYTTRRNVHVTEDKVKPYHEPFIMKDALLGLVGLHINIKTKNHPGWIWTTFEQVDNYEVTYNPLANQKPTFNSGSVAMGSAEANRQPALISTGQTPKAYYWNSTGPTAGDYQPTEVQRCPNEPPLANVANEAFRKNLLAVTEKTPWQYYRLSAVQWYQRLKDPKSGNIVNGPPLPKNEYGVSIARNSVLETYLIGDQTLATQVPSVDPEVLDADGVNPQSTLGDIIAMTIATPTTTSTYTWSSCLVCHDMAYFEVLDEAGKPVKKVDTDGSYVFFTFMKNRPE